MDPSPSPQQFQIVVAHHNEDLSWLHQYAKNTVVYSKGRPPPPPPPSSSNNGQFHQLQTLPNIGRESHTIAHHLYHAYNNLADVTMFTQGDIYNKDSEFWPHSNLPLPKMVAMALATPSHGMTSFAAMKATFRDWDGLRWVQYGEIQWLKVWASSLVPARLTPGEFWKYIHGEEHPTALHYHAHGLFAVRAESIRLKPRSFYARLLRYFEDLNTCNPEEGMYMERMWSAFFSESHIVRGDQEYTPILVSPPYTPVPYTMDECGPCREQSRYIKAYIKQQQIITKPEMVQESVEHLDVSVTDVD